MPQLASRLIAIILALQIMTVAASIEIEPFLSNYPMYSSTFDSPEAFNARYRREHRRVTLWVMTPSGCGHDVTTMLDSVPGGRAAVMPDESGRQPDATSIADTLQVAVRQVQPGPWNIVLEIATPHFDFAEGRFVNEIVWLALEPQPVWVASDRAISVCEPQ